MMASLRSGVLLLMLFKPLEQDNAIVLTGGSE